MESIMNLQSLNQIAEVELIYKTKIKASERVKISTSRERRRSFKKTWAEIKLTLWSSAKCYY